MKQIKLQQTYISLIRIKNVVKYYVIYCFVLSPGMNAESPGEYTSLKEEVFWLVATIPNVAANPALMVTSLMEFLSKYS